MSKERVLITVKTYPTLSTKYGELVCTAGIRESTGDEDKACRDVRTKIETLMNDRDLYLILGTTAAWHYIAPNPYLIIGLFYPPFPLPPSAQMSLEF